jgi:hypothetical protein
MTVEANPTPTYEPVSGTRWIASNGPHKGMVVVEVIDTNDRSVFFKYLMSLSTGLSRGMRKKSGRLSLSRAQWNVSYEPYGERDRKLCNTNLLITRARHVVSLDQAIAETIGGSTPEPIEHARQAVHRVHEEIVQHYPEPEPEPAPLPPAPQERQRHTVSETNSAGEQFQVSLATKRCTKCGQEKLLGLFDKVGGGTSYLRGDCKACRSEQNRRYAESRKQESPTTTQEPQEAPVSLTTTDNRIIEQTHVPAPASATNGTNAAAKSSNKLKAWKVRAYVYEEREFDVFAPSFREAGEAVEREHTQVEIVSIVQEGA